MNGGAYGRETKDALIEARGVDRAGNVQVYSNADMHYTYRHCGAPEDVIFTQALFQGAPGDPQRDCRRDGQDHRSRARRRSRSRAAPAVRPSRIRPATRPGN